MRIVIQVISGLFLPLLYLIIIQRCMTAFLGPGKRNFVGYIGWMVFYVFQCFISFGVTFPPPVTLSANILLVFIISSVTKRKKVMQRSFFSVLICAVWMLVEIIVVLALYAAGTDEEIISVAGSFISKVCMLLLSVVMGRFVRKKHYSDVPLRYFVIILMMPISSIYIMNNIFLILAPYGEHDLFCVIASLLLLFVNFVVFETYDWMCRDVELRALNRLYEQQLDLCNRQVEEQKSLYLKIRRLRHDMKNHLSSLLGMVKAEQTSEAISYIQTMLSDGISDYGEEVSRSDNIVVDSLVNHKYAIAQRSGIRFDASILIPAVIPFQGGHLTIILGNLLENAIEACQKMPPEKRYISLEISYKKEMLRIEMRNSCIPSYRRDREGKYLTTKKDAINHGMGLSSVELAVAYYHGEVKMEEINNEFRVAVVMFDLHTEK